MPLARVLERVDAQVTRIANLLGSGASVSREFDTPYPSNELKTLSGLHVWMFPIEYDAVQLDRAEDAEQYRFSFTVAERWSGDGKPTNAWMDDRVEIAQTIYDFLEDARNESAECGWCESADSMMTVCDVQALRELSMFWVSSPVFTYRIIREQP